MRALCTSRPTPTARARPSRELHTRGGQRPRLHTRGGQRPRPGGCEGARSGRARAPSTSAQRSAAFARAQRPSRPPAARRWHLLETLRLKRALPEGTPVHRVSFAEITKRAVTAALRSPQPIDLQLVHAQQARQAVDYLVGFTLSPVLWRKLPGCRSAGRVQSVALRLVVEREHVRRSPPPLGGGAGARVRRVDLGNPEPKPSPNEPIAGPRACPRPWCPQEVLRFVPREYWSLPLTFEAGSGGANGGGASGGGGSGASGGPISATLTRVNGEKLRQFDIDSADAAAAAAASLPAEWRVSSVKRTQRQMSPPAPYNTASLQQDASRRLGMGVSEVMRRAQ
eukprot:4939006-Prymnesium_polylepis.1